MNALEKIREIISEISDAEPEEINMDTQLEDVLDSLAIVNFFVKVGKAYGEKIPKMNSISEVVNYLEKR